MQLKLKLRSGDIHDLDVEELISVDGREYKPAASDVHDERLTQLEGRVLGLENLISQIVLGGMKNDLST